MRARASTTGVAALDWQQQPFSWPDQENDVSRETAHQLELYLQGRLQVFSVPLDLSGYTPKRRRWLQVMCGIAYGQTISYQQFAALWGNSKAARAAGQACSQNPIPIIIPCHRVITAAGGVENYGGGDPDSSPTDSENIYRKQWLIDLEARYAGTA